MLHIEFTATTQSDWSEQGIHGRELVDLVVERVKTQSLPDLFAALSAEVDLKVVVEADGEREEVYVRGK